MLKLAWNYMRHYKSQTFAIFFSILLTAALLAGISSLLFSSQKSDLANAKSMYGDWHYCLEVDQKIFQSVHSGEEEDGYRLKECGKMELRDQTEEPLPIYFIHADATYIHMMHRDLLKGAMPERADEIAADNYVLANLGFSGSLGDIVRAGGHDYVVTGILKSAWAANAEEMEIFVADAFEGKACRKFLYLQFYEDRKLYKQLDAFEGKCHFNNEQINNEQDNNKQANDEVVQYLGGEKPDRILDIVKFGLTEKEGNFTYIILKLQSEYNLAYHSMVALLCLFSLFVVYSVYSISAAKRASEYGVMLTLGISEAKIAGTMIFELWMLFLAGYPLGCAIGNGVWHILCSKSEMEVFFIDWPAMQKGFGALLISLAAIGYAVIRSLRKKTLKEIMNGDISFAKSRSVYALRHRNLADIVVRKFMFANKRKVIGILFSLSVGGCIFLCTTYMVENLRVHAELSLKSEDGLGSEYRISLKSTSLSDVIPRATAEAIRNMPETDNVYAVSYMLGELKLSEAEFAHDSDWRHYFDEENKDDYFIGRYGGICVKKADHMYGIKYNVYGYDEAMLKQMRDFILEGEIDPQDLKNNNRIVITANKDGQGNYYAYGKKPGDTVILRVPKMQAYTEERLKFQGREEDYVEKEFEIAAIVSRPLAQEQGFLHVGAWTERQSVMMTDAQMGRNFGIADYNFIQASPASGANAAAVSSQILQAIQDVPRAVLQDYTEEIETQKNYLQRQQLFFSAIAVILLVISLFHILNSMHYFILAHRREYGIMRAMGITDSKFYRMAAKAGLMYGIWTDVLIFLIYHMALRRGMDYYMAHVVQFLHLTAGVPAGMFMGIMVLNIVVAVTAVMIPARKLLKESIIREIRQ